MQFGMIGLGRMGANLVRRALAAGHVAVAYDHDPAAVAASSDDGAKGVDSIKALVDELEAPRTVWVMVPAAHVEQVTNDLGELLSPGDTIIDGGNSYYRDDIARSAAFAVKGIHYVDVGTSGGVHGLERGYCLMIGGEKDAVARLSELFDAFAPEFESAPRTAGRTGAVHPAERGWLHCGPSGAGHFVKMIHNGIEYGMMAAFAEGINVLRHANDGRTGRSTDAETAPLRDASFYQFDFDVAAVTELWRRGSVVSSWLLDLTAAALAADPDLESFAGAVSDSGEGRWTVTAAIDEGVPVPVLATALFERFSSQGRQDFADRVLSAMRNQFGGHAVVPREVKP